MIDLYLQIINFFPPEYQKYFVIVPYFISAFFVTFFITPIIGKIAFKLGITYKPGVKRLNKDFDNEEKAIHTKETPALGGLAVLLPVMIYMFFKFSSDPKYIPILIAFSLIIIVASLDDIFAIPSYLQMEGLFISALLIAGSTIDVAVLTNPLGGYIHLDYLVQSFNIFNIPFSIVLPGDLLLIGWILVCSIAVKVVGGSPGLIESNSFMAFIFLFILGIRTNSDFVITNSALIAGSLLAFLIFAFPPEKIFSGAPGKLTYGFFIAVFSIINGAKFASTLMIVMLPIIDFTFVLIKRYQIHKPKNLLSLMKISDTNHLHHQLLSIGFSRKQVLLIEVSITLFIGIIAVLSTGALKLTLLLVIALLLVILILVVRKIIEKRNLKDLRPKKIETPESPESKYSY